jgi:Putative zinc-finger
MTDLVFDYVHGKLTGAVKRDFEQHLRICPDCVNFLNTYRKTVQATGSVAPEEIPPQVRTSILAFLRKRVRGSRACLLMGVTHLVSAADLLVALLIRCIEFVSLRV